MLSEEEVLDFCNRVREAGGTDVLEALLPGDAGLGESCLIAKNLNFSCNIRPGRIPEGHDNIDNWVMIIKEEDIAKKISSAMDMEIIGHETSGFWPGYRLSLPSEIAEVARNFDNLHDEVTYSISEPVIPEDQAWLLEFNNYMINKDD